MVGDMQVDRCLRGVGRGKEVCAAALSAGYVMLKIMSPEFVMLSQGK